MPPPQRFLAPRIQGFVCRSCLAKLRYPRTHQAPWLSKFVASENGPRRSKPLKNRKTLDDQPSTKPEPVIRVWDETSDGVRTEEGTDPGDVALLKSMHLTMQEMREQMVAESESGEVNEDELQDRVLESQMQKMVEGGGLADMVAEEIESLMDKLDTEANERLEQMDLEGISAEERLKARDEIFERLLKEQKERRNPQPGPTQSEPLSPDRDFPKDIEEQLPLFVDAVQSATTLLDKGSLNRPASVEIWNAYTLCRKNFKSDPHRVPTNVWEALWNIFTDKKTVNYGFLKLLGQDMINAGLPMQNWQHLVHIQATFHTGSTEAAIKLWEECQASLSNDNDTSKEYWQVGRNMYTQQGQLDKALRAVEALIQSTNDSHYFRSILPIMQALLASEEKGRFQKVWALYIRLKSGLGHRMVMKDYDQIASMLFEADQPHMALGVFRDMMLRGDASAAQDDSAALFESGSSLKSGLNITNIDKTELTWDDPRVLAKLPAKYNNKFFFGKWLKKLIGDGKYSASVKVFNLMHERGIRPDARYVNGLIGAWLRTGKPKYHKLAEDTSWRMIEERLEYVKNRDSRVVLSLPLRPVGAENKAAHKPIWRHPNATIETFAILMEDYRRRQRHDRLKDLVKALQRAKIRPNTFLMNEIMMLDTSTVPNFQPWDTYTSLTRTQGVRPDFDTFGYLWHLTKRAVDPNLNPAQYAKVIENVQNLAVPRLLIAEMAIWARELNRGDKLPRKLYDLIILSFSLAQDHIGSAVALRFLQRYFNMFPNEDTVRTIVLQLARTGLKGEDQPRRRRLGVRKSPAIKDRMAQVTKLLESFKDRRDAELLQQGVRFDELSGDERLEESLILMTTVLQHATLMKMDVGADVADILKSAARDMGIVECVPSSPENISPS